MATALVTRQMAWERRLQARYLARIFSGRASLLRGGPLDGYFWDGEAKILLPDHTDYSVRYVRWGKENVLDYCPVLPITATPCS